VHLQPLKVGRRDDFGAAFAEAQRNRAEGLIVLASGFFYAHRTRLVELAAKHRLPAMYHQKDFVVRSGGLMSYGPDFRDLFRRAATYVDRILKGAKPADLPVEQPTKFELVINQNRQDPRPNDSTIAAAAAGRGDPVTDPAPAKPSSLKTVKS
jgi:putative tryptophan/tyrosine transport system substrate-binding protein